MRPNQQSNKNRSRGRNNNGGRKHLNPLSRNYESNGPDVKVRGNAAHVAEKYVQLARDAQASGDSVMAENYLQHAEHYFRIVSAAQQQMQPRPDQVAGQLESEDEDDDFPPINDRFSLPEPPNRYQQQPQQQQTQQGEQQVAAEGETADGAAESEAAGEGEGQADGEMPRRHRDRRGRRRGRSGAPGEQSAAGDPAGAPQPEVGELPAFLTAGNTTAAE